MNFAKTFQEMDFSLLENFIYHARSVLKQDLPDPDKIFALDGPFLATLLQDHSDVSSVISVMQDLKALSRALSVLSHIVREGITSMRSGVLPIIYHRGLLNLPVETIGKIFEEVFADDTGACTSLSLVSKDFRNIALQIPRLWTHLTDDNCPKHYLERSKSVGIDIKIDSGEGSTPSHTRQFFRMVAPHSCRWRSFSISGFQKTPRDIFLDLAVLSSVNPFYALETLHVDYKYDVLFDEEDHMQVVENEQDPDKDQKHFFNTWRMPALRTINTVNLIPMLPTTSVTCFRLELSQFTDNINPIWSMHEVTRLLCSLHSLTELSIDLVKNYFDIGEEATPVELPQLKKLKLRMEPVSEEDGDYTIRDIVEAISAPNVSELTIYIKEFFLNRQLEALFPKDGVCWPCLESLDLEFCSQEDGLDDTDSDVPLNIAFSRLPARLRHLRMSCDRLSPPRTLNVHKREQGESPYPPLRTLRLGKSFDLDASFIFSIKDIINAPIFESLEIDDCPEINEEVVRNMLPKDKVFKYRCTVPRLLDFSDNESV